MTRPLKHAARGIQTLAVTVGVLSLFFGVACCGVAGWLVQNVMNHGQQHHNVSSFHATGIRDGQFEFQIRSFHCGDVVISPQGLGSPNGEAGSDTQGGASASSGEQFCEVTLYIHNVGNQPRLMQKSNQSGVGSNGDSYNPDDDATEAANSHKKIFPHLLMPDSHLTCILAFEVPADVTLEKLRVHDSPLSQGKSLAL